MQIYYEDKNIDFPVFIKQFLDEMIRVCNWVILTPGHPNLYTYIKIREPSYGIRFWYKPNDQTFVSSDPILIYQDNNNEYENPMVTSNTDDSEPILIYGKSREIHHMPYVFKHNMTTIKKTFGFEPIHPCPKEFELWKNIIQRAKPVSVLDPFIGSGTTAQVCEYFNIPWLGFDIMEQYSVDIDKRIKIGQKMRKEDISKRDRKRIF